MFMLGRMLEALTDTDAESTCGCSSDDLISICTQSPLQLLRHIDRNTKKKTASYAEAVSTVAWGITGPGHPAIHTQDRVKSLLEDDVSSAIYCERLLLAVLLSLLAASARAIAVRERKGRGRSSGRSDRRLLSAIFCRERGGWAGVRRAWSAVQLSCTSSPCFASILALSSEDALD